MMDAALNQSTIVALGGGGFSMSESGTSAIDDYLLELATTVRDKRSTEAHHRRGGRGASVLPRVCFVPTASGDNPDYIHRFEAAFDGRAETHVLSLFGQSPWGYQDPKMLQDMDLIYVGGGSTANLLTLWRDHGVDDIMALAASRGTILAGISAGANCWFEASSTDSFGPWLHSATASGSSPEAPARTITVNPAGPRPSEHGSRPASFQGPGLPSMTMLRSSSRTSEPPR